MLKSVIALKLFPGGIVVLGTLSLLGIWQIPQWQVQPIQQQIDALKTTKQPIELKEIAALEKSKLDAENAARTVLVQGAGGLFAAAAAYIAWRNLKATQEKQVAERFSKAVEQLGSENIHVRLGGIYALEQIAKDAEEKYYWQVMESLAAFIRKRSPSNRPEIAAIEAFKEIRIYEKETEEIFQGIIDCEMETNLLALRKIRYQELKKIFENSPIPVVEEDIRAVMKVLERLNHQNGQKQSHPLDMSCCYLKGLELGQSSQFPEINLMYSNLRNAIFSKANLQRAMLGSSDLQSAYLGAANLSFAQLQEANLQDAYLAYADLTYANLEGANLQGADLKGAILDHTKFQNTIGLSWEQLVKAASYKNAVLPSYLKDFQAPTSMQSKQDESSSPDSPHES